MQKTPGNIYIHALIPRCTVKKNKKLVYGFIKVSGALGFLTLLLADEQVLNAKGKKRLFRTNKAWTVWTTDGVLDFLAFEESETHTAGVRCLFG